MSDEKKILNSIGLALTEENLKIIMKLKSDIVGLKCNETIKGFITIIEAQNKFMVSISDKPYLLRDNVYTFVKKILDEINIAHARGFVDFDERIILLDYINSCIDIENFGYTQEDYFSEFNLIEQNEQNI